MDILQQLYGPFFDANNWRTVVTSGEDWMIILSLVLIECLLSVDNAIVLAAQTQVLPDKKQQEKSLFLWTLGSLYIPLHLDWFGSLSNSFLGNKSGRGSIFNVSCC